MNFHQDLFKAYMKVFFSRWYVWLSVLFSIIGSIALFYTPSLATLIVIVLAISFIGIFFSGFIVYQDLFNIIPSEYRLAYLPPKKGVPELQISQIGGSEYLLGYRDYKDYQLHQSNKNDEVLPDLAGHFNFKINNIGYIPVDILSIKGNINDFIMNVSDGIQMSHATTLKIDGNPINYPISLEHDVEIQIILYFRITPDNLLTGAQFAVKLREMLQSKKTDFISVSVEFVDRSGKIYWTTNKFPFLRETIVNRFIDNWKSLGRDELLRLAGHN